MGVYIFMCYHVVMIQQTPLILSDIKIKKTDFEKIKQLANKIKVAEQKNTADRLSALLASLNDVQTERDFYGLDTGRESI